MNPAGIPYLYLALEKKTAKQETLFRANQPHALATMKTKKPLKVLNLSDLPEIPSIFEPDKYNERHELLFLHGFKNELSKAILKNGKEHIDYIPTQIISEFYRHRFLDGDKKIDGVMYSSSKNPGGRNVTLFVSEHEEVEKMMTLSNIKMES